MPEPRFPSPFYRVSVKAIIRDRDRVLLSQNNEGKWEVPGGGWEHDEELTTALARELDEELHVEIATIGNIQCVWRDYSSVRGIHYLRLGVPVTLKSHEFRPDDGDLIEARFVTREEFLQLPFQKGEEGVLNCIDKIWSNE